MRSRLGDSDEEEMTTSRIVTRGKRFVPYVGDEQANVSPTVDARLHFPTFSLHSFSEPTPSDLPPGVLTCPYHSRPVMVDSRPCEFSGQVITMCLMAMKSR